MTNGGLILRGEADSNEKYIESFIIENKIPSYNIFRFKDPFKIVDARQIRRSLSLKTPDNKPRIFIIDLDPNTEAQNALLKTIEEIEENSLIVFMQEKFLLPTIFSRCKIVDTGTVIVIADEDLEKELNYFIENGSDNLNNALLFVENLVKEDYPMESLIFAVRSVLINACFKDKNKARIALKILKEIFYYYPLTITNNLNKKTMLERIFLSVG